MYIYFLIYILPSLMVFIFSVNILKDVFLSSLLSLCSTNGQCEQNLDAKIHKWQRHR